MIRIFEGSIGGTGKGGNSVWNSIKGWVSKNIGAMASIENSQYTGYYWLFETEAGYGWGKDNGKPINFTFDGPA